jgi:hypothetical protein
MANPINQEPIEELLPKSRIGYFDCGAGFSAVADKERR